MLRFITRTRIPISAASFIPTQIPTTTTSVISTQFPISVTSVISTQIRAISKPKKKLKEKKKCEVIQLARIERRAKEKNERAFPPVINARDRDEVRREVEEADRIAADEMKERIAKQTKEPLRFDMTGLEMSDRVKKLFDLTLGNQREIVKVQKQRGMELFQLREGDTGSSAVQVIALTTRIQQMQTHMKTHRKDFSGRRGLDRMYVRRRKLLDYMERKDFDSYRKVVKTLGLLR